MIVFLVHTRQLTGYARDIQSDEDVKEPDMFPIGNSVDLLKQNRLLIKRHHYLLVAFNTKLS